MGDYTQRLKVLKETHRHLDKKIDGMEKTGKFMDEELSEMKKNRLKMKYKIEKKQKVDAT